MSTPPPLAPAPDSRADVLGTLKAAQQRLAAEAQYAHVARLQWLIEGIERGEGDIHW